MEYNYFKVSGQYRTTPFTLYIRVEEGHDVTKQEIADFVSEKEKSTIPASEISSGEPQPISKSDFEKVDENDTVTFPRPMVNVFY